MKLLNKVKVSLLISLFIIILLSIKSFAVTGVITEITVNLREKPSTDSKRIMYVTQDDVVEVLKKDGEWYKIKINGVTGYVFGEYLKVDDSNQEAKEETTVTTNQQEETTTTETEETQIESEVQEEEKQDEPQNTNLIIKAKTQIRIVPTISSSIIYTASKDIKVTIIKQLNDWTYVSVGNVLGWVRTDKILEENEVLPDKKEENKNTETSNTKSEEETTKQETKTAYIKYDSVNLREKASTSAKVLAKLKLNEEVTVLEKTNSTWSKVKVDGKTGYISTELLTDEKQEEKKAEEDGDNTTSRNGETTSREETTTTKKEESTSSNKIETAVKKDNTTKKEENKEATSTKITGEDIVAYAKKYLGYDYVYGGASPSKGFDCSGFTYYVYKHFGYTLSRSSTAQASNGIKVAKKDLQPGDLVIYKNTSLTRIGHVGIYIGDNKMIHASEPGVGVIITDIDSKAYNYPARYVTARRIIK